MVPFVCSWKDLAKSGKSGKIPLKENDQEIGERIVEQVRSATAKRENAKTDEEKLAAAVLLDEAKALLKQVALNSFFFLWSSLTCATAGPKA